jgi:hypothetical protein
MQERTMPFIRRHWYNIASVDALCVLAWIAFSYSRLIRGVRL